MTVSATPKRALSPQIVGNVGLYYTCWKLSLMGWNVMPTARNARGIDVVAYNSDGSRYVGIQVKSLSKRSAVPVGSSMDKIMGDYWVVVTRIATDPVAYIMTKAEAVQRTHKAERDGKVSYWMEPMKYEIDEYRNAWSKVALPPSEA